nr:MULTISPECIES: hypothetical protein [Bifidobacterium]
MDAERPLGIQVIVGTPTHAVPVWLARTPRPPCKRGGIIS